jgi:hypothetical protein
MKNTTTTNITESTTTKGMLALSNVLDTFTRLSTNKDSELYTKQAIAFRTAINATCNKLGWYVIPQCYNDYIDTQYEGKTARSTRQAVKSSLVACCYLGLHGDRAKGYLDYALKGSSALESISDLEWASIKTKVNTANKKKAELAKQAKVKLELVESDSVVHGTTAKPSMMHTAEEIAIIQQVASKASTDAKPLGKVVMLETVVLGKDSEEKVTRTLNSLTKSFSEPELKRLAVLINNYLA